MLKPILITVALTLGVAPLAAQSQQQIVVKGTPPVELHRRAKVFVNSVAHPVLGQLPRVTDPICPDVIGIAGPQKKIATDRIRAVAAGIGAPVSTEAACVPNLMLIIVPNGSALVDTMRKTNSRWLTGLSREEINNLVRSTGPVRFWSAIGTVNEDNQAAMPDPSGRDRPVLRVSSGSSTRSVTKPNVMASTVIVDAAAASGKSVEQLADYAAMRALAYARGAPGSQVPSILNLFDSAALAEPRLSAADVAYLRSLYSASGLYQSGSDMARITDAVAATLR